MIHHEELNRRIIPLDGRRHLPSLIPQWLGDSRGRWEGHTLVIETTNFREQRPYAGVFTTDHLRLVERLTRVDADTIDYRFTVEDSTTWTKPWTATVLIEKSDSRLYEFVCHEANYSLQHILSGARAQEKLTETLTVGGDVPFLKRLAKPWFVYRPAQLIRRAMTELRPPVRGYTPLRTSWGVPIVADPTRAIGR